MAEEVLAITGVVSEVGMSKFGGVSSVTLLAAPDDDDTTYIYGTGSVSGEYTFGDCAVIQAGDTITNVSVRYRMKCVTTTDMPNIAYGVGGFAGDINEASPSIGNLAYVDSTLSGALDPGGEAWTLANVNNLRAQYTTPDATTCRCTTIVATITYTPAPSSRPPRGMATLMGVG